MEMEYLCVRVKAVKAFEQNSRIVCFWVDVSFAWCCCCCCCRCRILFIDVARRYYAFLWLFYIFNATLSMVMRKPDIQSMFCLAQTHDSQLQSRHEWVMPCDFWCGALRCDSVRLKCAEPIQEHRSAKYSIYSCILLSHKHTHTLSRSLINFNQMKIRLVLPFSVFIVRSYKRMFIFKCTRF